MRNAFLVCLQLHTKIKNNCMGNDIVIHCWENFVFVKIISIFKTEYILFKTNRDYKFVIYPYL